MEFPNRPLNSYNFALTSPPSHPPHPHPHPIPSHPLFRHLFPTEIQPSELSFPRQFEPSPPPSHPLVCHAGLLVASHIAWFRFFYLSVRVTLEWVLGFLLVVMWIVPLAFFISLSANEMVLPGAGSGLYPNADSGGRESKGGEREEGMSTGCGGLFAYFV